MRIKIDDENYIDVVEFMKGPLEIYNLELIAKFWAIKHFGQISVYFVHLGIKLENVLDLD